MQSPPTTLKMMHVTMRLPYRVSQVRTFLSASLLTSLLIGSSACVYRIPIQQGNFLDTKDIEQVSKGMTPAQVRYLLGTPMIADPFTKDRWDYVYYLKTTQMRTPEQRHFVVYFEQGIVSRIEQLDSSKP